MRESRPFRRLPSILTLCGLLWAAPAAAEGESRLDQVLAAIVANERTIAGTLEEYQPLVETYIQTVETDADLGTVPVDDSYFFGRLELPGERQKGEKSKKSLDLFDNYKSKHFRPESFARMLTIDRGLFDRETYEFEFVRAEFLGEIRTLVFDVKPKQDQSIKRLRTGRFSGRIWVEDQDYNIVRYNGVYSSILATNFHFDSWRLNLAPGVWLPAYVYTEEPERRWSQRGLTHKGQTRIWGYEIDRLSVEDEFTKVLIDTPQANDQSEDPGRISPVQSARAWEREAEDNLLQRLERVGLLAPAGEVDEVLQTVVTNLEITNELDIQPPVRCRVLLTTPLESFTIGHTIVLSRGLIDVLPDEASLATVLAHELGHVLSGHEVDTRYAFSDRMLVADKQTLRRFEFDRDPSEEREADDRAIELLNKSPYADKLGNAGLFLKALAANGEAMPALIRPHFGNRMAHRDELSRMTRVAGNAPDLEPASIEQVAALPLGGRVKVDPWSGRVELMKNNRVALLSVREKFPFQVTPLMPYLARNETRSTSTTGEPVKEPGIDSEETQQGEAVASDHFRRKSR